MYYIHKRCWLILLLLLLVDFLTSLLSLCLNFLLLLVRYALIVLFVVTLFLLFFLALLIAKDTVYLSRRLHDSLAKLLLELACYIFSYL